MAETDTDPRRIGEAMGLRARIKTNERLREDLSRAVRGVLIQYDIELDPLIGDDIIIAVPEELDGQLGKVVLPGGSNCR